MATSTSGLIVVLVKVEVPGVDGVLQHVWVIPAIACETILCVRRPLLVVVVVTASNIGQGPFRRYRIVRQQHEVVGHAAARYRAEDVIPTRGTGGSKHRRIRRIVNYADAANPTKILLAEVNVA